MPLILQTLFLFFLERGWPAHLHVEQRDTGDAERGGADGGHAGRAGDGGLLHGRRRRAAGLLGAGVGRGRGRGRVGVGDEDAGGR